jgi:hypothetical protein
VSCFESTGDLDGLAQSSYERARVEPSFAPVSDLQHAATIAQASGNIEQQILAAARLSEELLETRDDDGAYESFAKAMQLADRNGLPFYSARLLNNRAAYFFDKGDFLQSDNFNTPAYILSRAANMPWTFARCFIRGSKLALRMHFPGQVLAGLRTAEEQLRQFPNVALSAELAQLAEQARHTPARPEDSIAHPAPVE